MLRGFRLAGDIDSRVMDDGAGRHGMTSQGSVQRGATGPVTAPSHRLRAVVVLAVAALLATLAPPAAAQGESPWSSYQADPGNTRQAVADGPSDPGVRWVRDLAEPEPGDAVANADGWGLRVGRRGQGMPVVGPDGQLLLRASSEAEDTDDVLLALDPDDATVLWEHETDASSACEPAVDSQGRVWTPDFTGEENGLVGVDADSGAVRVSLEDGEDGRVPACTESPLLLGGQGDGERLVVVGRSGEPGDVVAVDVSADDGDVAIAWELDDGGELAEVLGAGDGWNRGDSFALSDDQLFLGVEDDDGNVELAAFDLDDGSVAARVGLPTPPAEDDEDPADHDVNDYRRLRMLVADDTLVLGPEDAEFDHLLAYDVAGGLTDGQDEKWLEREGTLGRWAMSSQGETVVTREGPRASRTLVGRSLDDGSVVWTKDSGNAVEEGFIPVGADGRMFVQQRRAGARAQEITALAPDGTWEWWFSPDGLAEALDVDDLDEVGYSGANTVFGPIDGDGTFYVASRSANTDAIVAIDSSGDIPTEFNRDDDDDDRLAGDDRIGTAIDLAQEFEEADTVLVARGDDFPDALAGAPLASHLDAPILLSNPGSMTAGTLAEVERLGASEARLLGGEVALSSTVEAQLEAAGLDVERYAGADRWQTAALIAEDLPEDDAAFVARGRVIGDPDSGWEDAVAVSALAAFSGTPILLTDTDTLPADTAAALAGRSEVTIAGGDAVVSPEVENAIDGGEGSRTERLAGADRWETSSEIADASVDEGMDPETTYLATGLNFPDALAAAPVVGATAPGIAEASGGVLLLVDGDDLSRSRASRDWLSDNAGDIDRIRAVGGPAVVTDDVVDAARGLVGIE